ncbi:hypothetical protein IV102_28155 [bacterium]|nr:hypothetical protein [bacterium]
MSLRPAIRGHYRNLVPAKEPIVYHWANCPSAWLEPRGPVVAYCASGLRSRMAASVPEKAGHQQADLAR